VVSFQGSESFRGTESLRGMESFRGAESLRLGGVLPLVSFFSSFSACMEQSLKKVLDIKRQDFKNEAAFFYSAFCVCYLFATIERASSR
jgi:hypothetical protein